jgi:hypothetical protein
MYDVFYIGKNLIEYQKLKDIIPTAKLVNNFQEAVLKNNTKMFWTVYDDLLILDYEIFRLKINEYDEKYIHVFLNDKNYDGLALVPKGKQVTEKEVKHRFFIEHKKVERKVTHPKQFDFFCIETWEDYEHALKHSSTEMFWATSSNIKICENFDLNFYFSHHDSYNRQENHVFQHQVGDDIFYNGLFLLSKNKLLTKKEIEYRHIVSRKEWQISASTSVEYDIFEINNFEDYIKALEKSKTEMFWSTSKQVTVIDKDILKMYFNHNDIYNRHENHAFVNLCNDNELYNGIFLLSKRKKIAKNEIDFRHIVSCKKWQIIASKHKAYDVVFVSYNEKNADENFEILKQKYPEAIRIHGIKGIHEAHIAGAKLAKSDMVWFIDADAMLLEDFTLEYFVDIWDRQTVHVWASKNPINDLVYGYGGVKLFPRILTINMEKDSTDMTTSISNRFKPMKSVSNITKFNTDPFNTWKSAFRECCKLSSSVIEKNQSKDVFISVEDCKKAEEEREHRLNIWCTEGANKKYGNYCILGAKDGRDYGQKNKNDAEKLKLINNFQWLHDRFSKYSFS